MKKLTKTARPTLTLTREVVRTISIPVTELHHVAGGGLRPAPTNRCSTGETTHV